MIPITLTDEQAASVLEALKAICPARYSEQRLEEVITTCSDLDWQMFANNSYNNDQSYAVLNKAVRDANELPQGSKIGRQVWCSTIHQALEWAKKSGWSARMPLAVVS